jgi:hypothetical protein
MGDGSIATFNRQKKVCERGLGGLLKTAQIPQFVESTILRVLCGFINLNIL